MQDSIFTIEEVSRYLKIPKSTIYKLSQAKKIPCVKIGKQLRYRKEGIDQWFADREKISLHKRPDNIRAKNILLIDDDELVLRSLSKLLKSHGYNVEPSQSGEEALDKMGNGNFKADLVITDVRMPGMDGIQTITRLRELHKEENTPAVPEIVITGFADQQAERQAQDLGISDYIYKPFATDDFIRAVHKKLEYAPGN